MKIKFKDIIGKHMLIGITCYDVEGNKLYSFELHGPIIYAKKGDKISIKVESDPVPSEIELNGDRVYSIPPDVSGIELASKGIYTLKSTGEKVIDPDLLASWSVTIHNNKRPRPFEPFVSKNPLCNS